MLPQPASKCMRFSVPNIPPAILSTAVHRNAQNVSPSEAVQRISSFLSTGRAAVLTGAGVSVDSGVKAYRGKDGRYTNPDYKCALSHTSSKFY
jgi:NAD+-dependent protein deacetylase sirtuin 4